MAIIDDRYPLIATSEDAFLFESTGRNGTFTLIGAFQKIIPQQKRTQFSINFNFAFGHYVKNDDGSISVDDEIELHNGDMDKIFNTVANEIYSFLKRNPLHVVYITGSTPVRTRKYQQLISKHYEIISMYLDIYGVLSTRAFAKFIPNSKTNYIAFLIENKIH